MLSELRARIEDELGGRLFFALSLEDGRTFRSPEEGWELAAEKWPRIKGDVVECSRCLALERYGGALFHAMQVAELGVVELSKLLGVAGDKPGWGAVQRLEEIANTRLAERSDAGRRYDELLKATVVSLRVMKDSWRHKIEHADNKLKFLDADFSEEMANEIIVAVRGFMRSMALKWPQEKC